ncbi:MAG: Rrf2 family transcriptional regulator [Deltaproteobacteria bacterium]|nr:Rrf2 family transcriptional regulator [Deltaproteobacteria bacterium]
MLYVATHGTKQPVTSHQIAREQGIPEPYLRQILALLSKDRLIISNRGPQGGHSLGRSASEINLTDILMTLEGQVTSVDQILALPCSIQVGPQHCVIREVFLGVKKAVDQILSGTSLQDLVDRQQVILDQDISVPADLGLPPSLLPVVKS